MTEIVYEPGALEQIAALVGLDEKTLVAVVTQVVNEDEKGLCKQ
jgi:hypothetical protein